MSTSNEQLYGNPQKPYGFELVADTLINQGVDCVFTLTGNSIVSLCATLGQKGVRVITCRTEQGCVLAAAGYAMNSGKVGVAICSGGFFSIAHFGLLTASWGHMPVVLIAGANETTADDLRGPQELDQKPIAKSANVKEAYHVIRGERIPQMLSWAFNTAQSGVPGAVFIDIAQDIMKSRVDAEAVSKYVPCNINAKTAGDPRLVKEAVKLLRAAKNPVITVGRVGAAADIGEELKKLVELTGIPVENCMGALGTHPLNVYIPPDNADVVLMLGKQSIGLVSPYPTAKIISVYPETQNFGHAYPVELGIAGDVKLVLQQLLQEVKNVEFPDYSVHIAGIFAKRDAYKTMFLASVEKYRENKPIHPAVVTKETVDFMIEHEIAKNSIMALDGGDCLAWYLLFSSVYGIGQEYPGQLTAMITIDYATAIGLGLPMALGAACSKPGTLLFIPNLGDGCIGYHLAELETMARLNVPAIIIVNNNSCWGMVYNDQRRIYGRDERSGAFLLQNVRYEKAAEGLGCIAGDCVTDSKDIRPAIEKAYELALRESKPVLVNIITDPYVYNIQYPNWTLPTTENGEPYTGIGE
jgi:thiamine pyrophosphate-dependent acetolactate synthase large subunit-like protein